MNFVKKAILLLSAQLLMLGGALAQEHGTAAEAQALVQKALAEIKAVGPEKAFEQFSAKDGKWQNKDLYVVVIKYDGTMMAHGANKALVGKPMMDMKDAEGKFFTKDMAEVAKTKGSGWVDYLWPNPVTKKTEKKSSFATAIPGYDGFVLVGIYK